MIAYSKRAKRQAKKAKAGRPRQASAAALVSLAADPWPDPTPTPERQAKGMRKTPSGRWVDVDKTLLANAYRLGAITQGMHEAGERWERLREECTKTRVPGGGMRDSLDFAPRGDGETSAEYAVRIRAIEAAAERAIPAPLLRAVDRFLAGERIRSGYDLHRSRWRLTHAGLTELAKFFGLDIA